MLASVGLILVKVMVKDWLQNQGKSLALGGDAVCGEEGHAVGLDDVGGGAAENTAGLVEAEADGQGAAPAQGRGREAAGCHLEGTEDAIGKRGAGGAGE